MHRKKGNMQFAVLLAYNQISGCGFSQIFTINKYYYFHTYSVKNSFYLHISKDMNTKSEMRVFFDEIADRRC